MKFLKKLFIGLASIGMAVGAGTAFVSNTIAETRATSSGTTINFLSITTIDSGCTLTGSSINKTSYLGIYGGANIQTNSAVIVDKTKNVTISMNARTYGGKDEAKNTITFSAIDSVSNSVLGSGTLCPTNNTLNNYSNSFTFSSPSGTASVFFRLASSSSSTSGAFTGLSSASVVFTEPSDYVASLEATSTSNSFTEGSTMTSVFTVSGTLNGVADTAYTNYSVSLGSLTGETYTERVAEFVSGTTTAAATDNAFKITAKDPTTDGGSTYDSTYISISVTALPKITSFSITESLSMKEHITGPITPTIAPATANQNVTYASSDETIATVSPSGVVTGIKEGTATITATTVGTNDSGSTLSDTCAITVSRNTIAEINAIISATSYVSTDYYTVEGTIKSTESTYKITLTDGQSPESTILLYQSNSVEAKHTVKSTLKVSGKLTSYNGTNEVTNWTEVSFNGFTVSSIAVTGTLSKTAYAANETFDAAGLTVTATYSDGSTAVVTSDVTWTPNPLTAGTTKAVGSYTFGANTVTADSPTITVIDRAVTAINVTTNPTKTDYWAGDTLNTAGLVVTGTYNFGSDADVTSSCTCSPTTLSTAGTQTITVTYSDTLLTDTFTVNVKEVATKTFVKVTSAPDSWEGTYLIAYENSETEAYVFDSALTTLDVSSNFKSATIANNSISAANNLAFRVESITGGYSIKSSNDQYIGRSAGSNGMDVSSSSSSSSALNTFELSESNAVIKGSGGYALRFNSTPGQTRFRFYGVSSQQSIVLYRLVDSPSAWVSSFFTLFTCDSAGITAPSVDSWNNLGLTFLDLSTTDQNTLKNTVAKFDGTDLQKALARYDYVVSKYGKTTYDDYMDRNPSSGAGYWGNDSSFDDNGSTYFIIVSAFGLVLAGLAIYFVNKRKRA